MTALIIVPGVIGVLALGDDHAGSAPTRAIALADDEFR